jgi:hypothetical protein
MLTMYINCYIMLYKGICMNITLVQLYIPFILKWEAAQEAALLFLLLQMIPLDITYILK